MVESNGSRGGNFTPTGPAILSTPWVTVASSSGTVRIGTLKPLLASDIWPPKLSISTNLQAANGTVTLIESVVAQLGLKQSRRNTVGSFTFQAAASGAVTWRQTAKRSAISVRHSVALSRCVAA